MHRLCLISQIHPSAPSRLSGLQFTGIESPAIDVYYQAIIYKILRHCPSNPAITPRFIQRLSLLISSLAPSWPVLPLHFARRPTSHHHRPHQPIGSILLPHRVLGCHFALSLPPPPSGPLSNDPS